MKLNEESSSTFVSISQTIIRLRLSLVWKYEETRFKN